MPALEAFGRRFHIGSDDFVFPGIFDLIIKISWYIAVVVIYCGHNDNLQSICDGGVLLQYFLYGVFGILQLSIFSDIALVHHSKQGSVLDTKKRRWVPPCLYLRLLLFVAEVVWITAGTYWYTQCSLACPQNASIEALVMGFIVCSWIMICFAFIFIFVMYDSMGGRTLGRDPDVDPKLARCWSFRWRFLCLYWWTKNKDVQATFREFGNYMASAFETSDIVFTDLLCGFVLLFLKNREIRENQKKLLEKVSVGCNDKHRKTNNNGNGVEWPVTEQWNNLSLIHHYYQYAVACYSYGAILCTSSNPFCDLWQDAFCCGCFRKHPSDFYIEGDNCCFLHSGSTKDAIRLRGTEIVFCSFYDKVFQTPFFVALDHHEKSIVIAIRGTMSRVDVVTDIYVKPTSMERFGYPKSYHVHNGMLMNAVKVFEKLEEESLLSRLMLAYPDFKIVTTGTSLGSASATLLGMILRKKYPETDVKCFAYSPSGALMNLETAKYCETFVTSVIYGDDFVGRLAVKSIERLKYDVLSALKECQTPKYRLLLSGFLGFCGYRPKVTFYPDISSIQNESKQEQIQTYGFDYSEINVVQMEFDKSCKNDYTSEIEFVNHENEEENTSASSSSTINTSTRMIKPVRLLKFELMHPPGRILHVTETSDFCAGRRKSLDCEPRWSIRWADRLEFREIVFSARMLMDHAPFRPNKALKDLKRRWESDKLSAKQ